MANIYGPSSTVYSSRQRAVSLTLGVACSIPLTSTMALANVQLPTPTVPTGSWAAHSPVTPGFQTASQSSGHHSVTSLVHSSLVGLHTPVPPSGVLNLASSSLSYLAGNLANFSSLTIDVGGKQEQVGLNTKLTAAEVVAVEQVITGGSSASQTIAVGSNGVATGGTVSLNNNLLTALDNSVGGSISSLTIAKGVQVVDSLNVLSLSGGLSNYGSILTAAGSSGSSDTISAGTILNASGGAIGSYSGGGGLVGADPVLTAGASLTNNGSITSAGNLAISAPVVYNVASHGSAASINAAQNVNINTQSLTNSGTVAAGVGNVNLASTAGLNLTGTGGTLQANNGNINLSSSNGDINVSGGNFLSQQVNFNAGTGNINAQMGEVTGLVNASGDSVHVGASTANLNLGTIDATGDPTFTNTGNLSIDKTITGASGTDLTLIAGGNIVSVTGNTGINLSSTSVNGGNLNLIAGAAFTPFTIAGPPIGQAGNTIVTKASASGGIIDLTGTNIDNSGSTAALSSINTSSTDAKAAGGSNVQMVAFAGKTLGSGGVFAAGVPINATTPSTTAAGDVTIIAGAKSGESISTGTIQAANVTVNTATPVITPAKGTTGVVFALSGTQTTGTFVPSKTPNAASIVLGDIQDTGVLTITTGGGASVTDSGAAQLNVGNVTLGKTGSFVASNGANNIDITGLITGGSTSLTVTGGGKISTSLPGSINTTSLSVSAVTGNTNLTTNVSTLVALSTSGSVGDTQTTGVTGKAANTLNLSGTIGGTGTYFVSSTGQINVNALIKVNSTTVNITTTGKGGISIAAPISVGLTGTINLQTATGLITETAGNVLTADVISLITGANIGSKTLPFFTNAQTLSVSDTGAKNSAYVTDQNPVTLAFSGTPAAGGSLFLTATGTTVNIGNVSYNNVSITDSVAGALLAFGTGDTVGTGTGTVTVSAAGLGSTITGTGTTLIKGTTVTLTGASGIGTSVAVPMFLTSPNLVLNSAQGSVFASDNAATTVNGSSSLNAADTFFVNDNGSVSGKVVDSLTVGKSVAGGTIDLTTGLPVTGTAGSIAITGTLGTFNTTSVTLGSIVGLTTKGAISGAKIGLTANGGPLVVGGAVGGLGSSVTLTTTGAATDTITVGGVLSGKTITVDSIGLVTTTKAITASGPGSAVSITGAASATTNAVVIGAAVSGLNISIGLDPTDAGGIAINANVGGATTAATMVDASTGGGGAITGKGIIGGLGVTINATLGIGTLKAPIQTQAINLSLNAATTNVGGTFIAQKGNVAIDTVNTDNLVIKVTGTTDVVGLVAVQEMALTSTSSTVIEAAAVAGNSTITSVAGVSAGPLVITSGGAFTTKFPNGGGGNISSAAEPVTINVTGAANINGLIAASTLNLTTSGALTIGTTGSVIDGKDNITSKGAITVGGILGNGTDVFKISTSGAFTIGFPLTATVDGTGTINGLTIANYGTSDGSITYNATGTGNAFNNAGTIGNAIGKDSIAINAAKGSIIGSSTSIINETSLSLIAGGSATVYIGGTGATTSAITSAAIKGALQVYGNSGYLTIGGAAVGSVTATSVTVDYNNPNATNNNITTLNSITTTNGNLLVSSNAQSLQVGGSASISTTNGNITLQNTYTQAGQTGANIVVNAGAAALPTTILGSGAKTNLGQGNVYIVVGALPPAFTPVAGGVAGAFTTPVAITPVESGGGLVTFGAAGSNPNGQITVPNGSTGVTLTAVGRNIVFNTGATLGAAAITVNSNVSITADPPAGSPLSLTTAPSNLNVLTVPVAALGAGLGALTNQESITTSSAAAASSGLSVAAINNASVTTLTVGNSGISAGFLSSMGTGGTAQTTIESVNGSTSIGTIGGSISSTSGSSLGSKNGSTGLRTLTGGVSNTVHKILDRGPLLLSPEQNTVVETPFGSVSVAANSVALIISSDNGLAVYNMHDARKNAVVISNGSATTALSPGRSGMLTKSSVRSFEEVNPAPFVGYRQVAGQDVSNESRLYQSEFDMMSMVRGLPALKHLMASDCAKTRRTMGNMLKTAAILMQLSQSSEAYSLYLSSAKTAYLSSAQR